MYMQESLKQATPDAAHSLPLYILPKKAKTSYSSCSMLRNDKQDMVLHS